jgi:hypothetical protein
MERFLDPKIDRPFERNVLPLVALRLGHAAL